MKKLIIIIVLAISFNVAFSKPRKPQPKYNRTEIVVKASTMVLIPVCAVVAAPIFAVGATVAVIVEFVVFDRLENKPKKRKQYKCK